MFFEKNKKLAHLTTYKIGGFARHFVSVQNIDDIKEAIEFQQKNDLKVLILGGGSNLLISEKGFDGLVIKVDINFTKTQFCPPVGRTELGNGKKIIVEIGAGKEMQELVLEMCQNGYKGLEWAGGLPGTLGGAIRGNAGCFNGEIKDNILEIKAINLKTKEIKIFNKEESNFNYRNSFFKQEQDWLIISAKLLLKMINAENKKLFSMIKNVIAFFINFQRREINFLASRLFKKGNKNELLKIMQEKIDYRKKYQPLEYPSAGSVFKNFPLHRASEKLKNLAEEKKVIKTDPFPVIPVAFIIDECRLKGKKIGGAKISEKHPNFIVNFNNAKFQDVVDLINFVKDSVFKKFFINLEEEIQII